MINPVSSRSPLEGEVKGVIYATLKVRRYVCHAGLDPASIRRVWHIGRVEKNRQTPEMDPGAERLRRNVILRR